MKSKQSVDDDEEQKVADENENDAEVNANTNNTKSPSGEMESAYQYVTPLTEPPAIAPNGEEQTLEHVIVEASKTTVMEIDNGHRYDEHEYGSHSATDDKQPAWTMNAHNGNGQTFGIASQPKKVESKVTVHVYGDQLALHGKSIVWQDCLFLGNNKSSRLNKPSKSRNGVLERDDVLLEMTSTTTMTRQRIWDSTLSESPTQKAPRNCAKPFMSGTLNTPRRSLPCPFHYSRKRLVAHVMVYARMFEEADLYRPKPPIQIRTINALRRYVMLQIEAPGYHTFYLATNLTIYLLVNVV